MIEGLRPYPRYRRLELPWLDAVPEHWEMIPNRALMQEQRKVVGKTAADHILLSLTLAGIIPRNMETPKGKFPAQFNTYKIVNPDDLVFCLFDIDETPRAIGHSKLKGMITGAYDIFTPRGYANARYLYHYYLFIDEGKQLKPLYTGLRKTIQRGVFASLKAPYPPPDEQAAIVRFLDHVNRKIDGFIRAKRKLIGLLNEQKQVIIHHAVTRGLNPNVFFKPSGIPWLGDIPAHWDTPLNQRIFREKIRPHNGRPELQLSLSQRDGLIATSEMQERSLQTSSYDNWKVTLPGDLVLNRFKAHLGVFFCATLRGIVSFHYGVFAPRVKLQTKYFELLFHTAPYRTIYAGRSNGMTVGLQNLSNQNFYNVRAIAPPVQEQAEIVAFSETATAHLNVAIARTKREIGLMQEYRTRLTADIVTGKLDVREAALKLPALPQEIEPSPDTDVLVGERLGDSETEESYD
jgi:type I restriction enzyme S subunit